MTAALVMLGVLGLGTVAIVTVAFVDRLPRLDAAERSAGSTSPPADADGDSTTSPDEPVVTQAPTLTVSSQEPFPWVVAASGEDDGRWCLTAVRGVTGMRDATGTTDPSDLPCDAELRTEQDVDWVELEGADGGDRGLVGGIAPPDAEHVVVELTDGTRRTARLQSGDAVDVTLWAVGFDQGEVRAVEAEGDGWTRGVVVLEDGWGVDEMLIVLGGMTLVGTVVVVTTGRRIARRRR